MSNFQNMGSSQPDSLQEHHTNFPWLVPHRVLIPFSNFMSQASLSTCLPGVLSYGFPTESLFRLWLQFLGALLDWSISKLFHNPPSENQDELHQNYTSKLITALLIFVSYLYLCGNKVPDKKKHKKRRVCLDDSSKLQSIFTGRLKQQEFEEIAPSSSVSEEGDEHWCSMTVFFVFSLGPLPMNEGLSFHLYQL